MILSKTFDTKFKTEIGRKLLLFFLSPDLKMGTTLAILRPSGNMPVDKEVFIISAIIGDNKKEIRLKIKFGMLSISDFLDLKDIMVNETSSAFISK